LFFLVLGSIANLIIYKYSILFKILNSMLNNTSHNHHPKPNPQAVFKPSNPSTSLIDLAFRKYSSTANTLSKLEFKCAFIFLTGFKPSKQDIKAVADYISSTQVRQSMSHTEALFQVEFAEFEKIMGLYMEQIRNTQGSALGLDEVWKQLNGGKA
jgi:hypothetical protein